MTEHSDGSPCLEGTRNTPDEFTPCCDEFAARTYACAYDIRYEYYRIQGWVIALPAASGGGGISIRYCPHCGSKLP